MIIQLAAKTHKGLVREGNEDNFIVTENISNELWVLPKDGFTTPSEGSLLAVADGMGGMNAGEVASQVAVESVKDYFSKLDPKTWKEEKILTTLKNAVLHAHKAILKKAGKDKDLQDMGTTLVIGWLVNDKLYLAWSGDSRCYYFREPQGLRQLSKDHSYVQTLVDEGKITAEQAFFHPQSNIVLQSLGDRERPPEPDTAILPLAKDDIILLCSDGLSGMLTDKEIEEIIRAGKDNVQECIDTLVDAANAAGGGDNITVVLSKVIEGKVMTEEEKETTVIDRKKKKGGRRSLFLLLAVSFLLVSTVLSFVVFHNGTSKSRIMNTDSTGKAPAHQDSAHLKGHQPPPPEQQPQTQPTRTQPPPAQKVPTQKAPEQKDPTQKIPGQKAAALRPPTQKPLPATGDTIRLHIEKQDSIKIPK